MKLYKKGDQIPGYHINNSDDGSGMVWLVNESNKHPLYSWYVHDDIQVCFNRELEQDEYDVFIKTLDTFKVEYTIKTEVKLFLVLCPKSIFKTQ